MAYFCDNLKCILHKELPDDVLCRPAYDFTAHGRLYESRRHRYAIQIEIHGKQINSELYLCEACHNVESVFKEKQQEMANKAMHLTAGCGR